MIEMFKYQFMQNAAFAGLIVGVLCSVLSVFVVLKRMAFIGEGIAHAAFGGIAFAVLFGLDIFITTNVFCILVAIFIGLTSRKGRVSEDSSIGLFLTTSMALGVIFLYLKKGYTQDIFGYLFGNILSVSRGDVVRVAVLGAGVLILLLVFYRKLQFFTFDEEMARVSGVSVTPLYFLLLVILSMVIVMSVQVVGVILVSALLVVPATVALLVGRRFLSVMVISVVVGVISVFSGLVSSFYFRIPSGALIVVILFLLFMTAFLTKKFKEKSHSRKLPENAEGLPEDVGPESV